VVEHHVANVAVEGSTPFTRSFFIGRPKELGDGAGDRLVQFPAIATAGSAEDCPSGTIEVRLRDASEAGAKEAVIGYE
jgi:hypothetical protein